MCYIGTSCVLLRILAVHCHCVYNYKKRVINMTYIKKKNSFMARMDKSTLIFPEGTHMGKSAWGKDDCIRDPRWAKRYDARLWIMARPHSLYSSYFLKLLTLMLSSH